MKLNSIIEGNSFDVLKEIETDYIDMIITSPPYNAAHDYDSYDDNQEFSKYLGMMKKIFKECYRILKKGGRICVNVPFAIKNKKTKKVTFLSHGIASILNEIGFCDFEWITWHKGKNMNHFQGNNTAWGSWKSPSCPSFRPLGEAILVFYKEEKRHIGKKEDIDITAEEFKEWTKNTWYFSESDNNIYEDLMCVSNNASKKDHPAPFPCELVERLLKLYSYKNDVILDPFNGIGTTTQVAEQLLRNYIGIDLSKKYCDIALTKLKKGKKLVFNEETSKLVNSDANENSLNLYFPYKEGFSPKLVPYLIERYQIKNVKTLLDPFVGTGSVFINDVVEECYGYDTSKLAINITKSKLEKLDPDDIAKAIKKINSFTEKKVKYQPFPSWEPYHKYVDQEKYNIVMSLIDAFKKEDESLYRFIQYILISNLSEIFDYKRDGNGIKYRKSKLEKEEVLPACKKILREALEEKKRVDQKWNKKYHLENSSSTNIQIDKKVDLVVTSPPYANMFDYFEVYKIELWTSGIIKDYETWRKMKKTALRSNKNALLKKEEKIKNQILEKTLEKMEQSNVAESTRVMIQNYFYDMKKVMKNCYQYLKDSSYMFIVVGNSFYGGIPLITDEILIEEAKKEGFSFIEMIRSRKLSTSSQQMRKMKDYDKEYLRESIIVLRKEKIK